MRYAKAITKFIRISPKRARFTADIIRGLTAQEAKMQLQFCRNKTARHLAKTLNSAIANAQTQLDVKEEDLRIHEVHIDEGPRLKRAKSRSKGGRSPILKRMSHFTIVLASK
ncbi:MAG: 50S ribosomal protein L22 [Parachlamydiales bacterium]|nr:50S ribosomal protein L22 [Parachlamydiales bacterium]